VGSALRRDTKAVGAGRQPREREGDVDRTWCARGNRWGPLDNNLPRAIENLGRCVNPARGIRARNFGSQPGYRYSDIRGFPTHLRLAFEMAAHEETERVALQGELTQLEADWREAEEVASIADNMFIPSAVSDFIQRHRSRKSEA